MRLRRADCSGPGLRRIRRGRGFSYLDERGDRITDPETLLRIRELAIPPAWEDVWICSDPCGHLQATGTDAADRKQYLYHPLWRARRDREKFERALRFARSLPQLRRGVCADLGRDGLDRERVLACAARLLDRGLFRVGSDEYAEADSGIGLATIRKEHLSFANETAQFDYPGKGGIRRVQSIGDPESIEMLRALKRRHGGGEGLLAYRNGRRWAPIHAEDINDYLKAHMGEEFTAKDFRTWNATMLAAVVLAVDGRAATTKTARRRAINAAVREVAEVLGNTPAVARRAYIDPCLFDRFQAGVTIAPALRRRKEIDLEEERMRTRVEKAVLKLLSEKRFPASSGSTECPRL
jgi:DNA topoisomerase IB